MGIVGKQKRVLLFSVVSAGMCVGVASAQPVFVDVSQPAGILAGFEPEEGMGTGLAAADYDGDGLVDVFVPQRAGVANRLYHNLGNGVFEEIAAAVGLASLASTRTALWFDYDGDFDLDLVAANDDQQAPSSFTLYRQNSSTAFQDVTFGAGLLLPPIIVTPTHHWGGLCAGDVNHDGWLDLFATQWPGPCHLFLNNRQGGFVDISNASGVGLVTFSMHSSMMADVDRDGWMDIYVAVDFDPNLLWMNQKDLTFLNRASAAGAANNMNDMGMTMGDYDNDGDLDIYVTNIFMPPPPDNPFGPRNNILLRNETANGQVWFDDVSMSLGVADGGFGWGTTFLDGDHDGWVDLAATNGWRSGTGVGDVSRYFVNAADGVSPFTEQAAQTGFDDNEWGSALVAFDLERDGDLDMMQACMSGPLRLLANAPPIGDGQRHYLTVVPRMDGPNHFAIGALVRATVGGLSMMRPINAGTSYMGQEPAEAHFGLPTGAHLDSLVIDWPDGSTTTLMDVLVDARIVVDHGGLGDLDADGDVDRADYQRFHPCLGGPFQGVDYERQCLPADMNGDRGVDLGDFAVFQSRLTSP
ncbi:MAG: CRTAC1 family protein [Phycisphaerae bacterium]